MTAVRAENLVVLCLSGNIRMEEKKVAVQAPLMADTSVI